MMMIIIITRFYSFLREETAYMHYRQLVYLKHCSEARGRLLSCSTLASPPSGRYGLVLKRLLSGLKRNRIVDNCVNSRSNIFSEI